VPFKPDPSKLVYCSECFEFIKNKKRESMNGEQSIHEPYLPPANNHFSKPTESTIEQKRKELKEKIDNSGLADTLKNLFKQ
jgi:hypothetical protein